MPASTLAWNALVDRHPTFHLARIFYRPGMRVRAHRHDFAEVAWVEQGRLRQEGPGWSGELGPGAGVCVMPAHEHGFHAGDAPAILVNLALPADDAEAWIRRYGDLLWRPGPRPWSFTLAPGDVQSLAPAVAALAHGPGDAIDRDWLLLDLVRRLRPDPLRSRLGAAPAWLLQAVEDLRRPPLLADGLAGLVKRCGCRREHVARTVRRHLGLTATALVAELRLAHAECRLRLGEEPFAAIAAECGARNVAHLHRQFAARYGLTPGAYRRRLRGHAHPG